MYQGIQNANKQDYEFATLCTLSWCALGNLDPTSQTTFEGNCICLKANSPLFDNNTFFTDSPRKTKRRKNIPTFLYLQIYTVLHFIFILCLLQFHNTAHQMTCSCCCHGWYANKVHKPGRLERMENILAAIELI